MGLTWENNMIVSYESQLTLGGTMHDIPDDPNGIHGQCDGHGNYRYMLVPNKYQTFALLVEKALKQFRTHHPDVVVGAVFMTDGYWEQTNQKVLWIVANPPLKIPQCG
jgi:hypothetical protein